MGAPGKTGRILSKWWYFPCRSKARSVQAPAAQDEPPDILSVPPSLLAWAGCGPVLLRDKAG